MTDLFTLSNVKKGLTATIGQLPKSVVDYVFNKFEVYDMDEKT